MGNRASRLEPKEEKIGQERKEGRFPTVESWNDAETKLTVTQPEGYSCKVSLQTRIHMPPAELYDVLTKPDNSDIFRNIKRMRKRQVLEDDRRGRQLIEVVQEGKWKFLCFSGTLVTDLYVRQNRRTHEIDFNLKSPGHMKRFEGKWRIKPFNQATLDEVSGFSAHKSNSWLPGGFHPFKGFRKQKDCPTSLLTLEQSILPKAEPPKALQGIVKGIAARQVRNMVEDVRKEVDRREAERRRNQPMPSTSAAPLGSLYFRYGPKLAGLSVAASKSS